MELTSRVCIRIFILGIMLSQPCIAADDAYLKMLNGEAEELQLDQSGQLKQDEEQKKHVKKNTLWSGSSMSGEDIPAGLLEEEFVDLLRHNFYGTFVFYNRLDSADRQTVFYRYNKTETPNLEEIRAGIMDLLRK